METIEFSNNIFNFIKVKNDDSLTGTVEVGTKVITLVYEKQVKLTETVEERGAVRVIYKDEFDNVIKDEVILKDNVLVNTTITKEDNIVIATTPSGETYNH